MESIAVGYKPIGYDFVSMQYVYHKYLIYIKENCQEYARGGPDLNIKAVEPLGKIITESGNYIEGTIDYSDLNLGLHPIEIIQTGSNLSAQWEAVLSAINNISLEGHTYHPLIANSNSVVDTALYRAGLNQPVLDDDGEYLSPGSGHILPASPQIITQTIREESEFIIEIENEFFIAETRASPLILDLNNSGTIDLISLANSEAYWDNDVDGFRSLSGWVSSDDGLLALDVNENGIIDDNAE